jgi:hypothetical protein
LNRTIAANGKEAHLKVVAKLAEEGEKPTRKAKSYLIFRQFLVVFLNGRPQKGATPKDIYRSLAEQDRAINPNTVRGYLLRMRKEGKLSSTNGRWFLADEKKAGESANSRLPDDP